MSVFIKLAAYLIGAVALLFALTAPKPDTALLPQTEMPETHAALATTTDMSRAEDTATITSPKEQETKTAEEPRPIALPKPPIQKKELPSAFPKDASPVPAATTSPPVKPPHLSFAEINKQTRAALVNIICTTLRSGLFEPLSGSGVVIDPKGVILTNAHVAEYFLLKDYFVPDFVQCVIRTGEPARNRYKAKLLYLSPLWIEANYKKIRIAEATGTGEHDFAFLLITESVNPETLPLPKEFPALEMDFTNETLREKNQVLAAGYPAGFLSGINIQKEFYPSSSVVTTGGVFTFRGKTPDIFSIGGSLLAQQGSSGGAVVSNAGSLIGLIVTSSSAPTTGERDLHAITPSHIAQSFKQDAGRDIRELFAGDLAETAESFNTNVAPALTKLLEGELTKRPE